MNAQRIVDMMEQKYAELTERKNRVNAMKDSRLKDVEKIEVLARLATISSLLWEIDTMKREEIVNNIK